MPNATTERSAGVTDRLFDEEWNVRQIDEVDELYAPDFVATPTDRATGVHAAAMVTAGRSQSASDAYTARRIVCARSSPTVPSPIRFITYAIVIPASTSWTTSEPPHPPQ
jgi:hypothetical protein